MNFKNIILIIVLVLSLSTASLAQSKDDCILLGDLAQRIMYERQNGMHKSDLMLLSDGSELVEIIIEAAYEHRRMYSPDRQIVMILNFRNWMELICYNSIK